MPLVYVCPKCSAASALAPSDPAACKSCGAHAPREAMPTIQLARDREMPRLFHAIIVVAAAIAGLHFVGFGSVVIPFTRDSNWEAAGFNPLHQILTSGLIGLFFLAIALGLHWERPWGRHLAVLGWVACCFYGFAICVVSIQCERLRLPVDLARERTLCFVGPSIVGMWYFTFARGRALCSGDCQDSEKPNNSARGAVRPGHRAAARAPDVNGGRGQSPFPWSPRRKSLSRTDSVSDRFNSIGHGTNRFNTIGHGPTSPRGEVTSRHFHNRERT